MEQHGDQQEHAGVHLPDPSVWPLVVGIAALLLGVALVWWSDNQDSTFAGPLLGAAIAATLVGIGGWAYEDGRMKRKAESGELHGARDARYTQVITFAVAPGQFLAARAEAGVISAVERAAGDLHGLAGFQDLRVITSSGGDGPSQVLVETTWAGREDLSSYEESRNTLLDVINAHESEIVAGSVQVFDMEVVRDTKDVAFRFSWSGAIATGAALAVGGLMLALGLSVFQEEETAAADGGGGGGGGGFDGTIVAQNTTFRQTSFQAPPNTEISITLDNRDNGIPHNLAFHDGGGAGDPLLTGCTSGCAGGDVVSPLQAGPRTDTITFTTPGAGSYFYVCQAHANMTGTMTIAEGAPVPGGAPAAPAEGAPTEPAGGA